MSNRKNITIKDIAKMSGVSAGTVDRVLHNRGRVSEDALQKVVAVLNQIDYKPNLLARSLGSKKTFRVAVLVPDPDLDPYWVLCSHGIKQAEEEWGQYGVVVEPYFFDLYDSQSFIDTAQKMSDAKPDGVLLAPVFHHEALPFFAKFEEMGVPYVFVNTNIQEASPLTFIGQDLYQSGKVGAELMAMGQPDHYTVAIVHIHEDVHNSVHLEEKERGFRDYFQENTSGHANIKTFDIRNHDEESTEKGLLHVLESPQLNGIFASTSSGTTRVAEMLQKQGKNSIRLIGYDMLDENLRYLRLGIIDFLINQNPKYQTFTGVSQLTNHLLFRKNYPAKHLFPLEVITRQNLDSYLNSSIH